VAFHDEPNSKPSSNHYIPQFSGPSGISKQSRFGLKGYHFASVEEIQENTKTRVTATLKEAVQVFPSAD
jgi:hypothetical protein